MDILIVYMFDGNLVKFGRRMTASAFRYSDSSGRSSEVTSCHSKGRWIYSIPTDSIFA
jgi:hypothetical protein